MNIDEMWVCAACLRRKSPEGPCPQCGFDEASHRPEPYRLPPEALLKGRYLLGAALGEGGFGITYAAWDLTLSAPVAVKEYFPVGLAVRDATASDSVVARGADNAEGWFKAGMERFLREARVLATLSGVGNIVSVQDCFEANGTAYIVMAFIEGVSLLKYAQRLGGKLSGQELFRLMRPALDALQLVHRAGLIHRDLSPDNLLLDRDDRVWLIDFGAAVMAPDSQRRKSLSVVVHGGYTPIEQYETHGAQGPWTDVYALCASLYRLLTGALPPESIERVKRDALVPPRKAGARITPRQERALLRGLAVAPLDRTPNVETLVKELYGAPARRKRFLPAALSAAVIAILLAVNSFIGFPANGYRFTLTVSGARVVSGGAEAALPARFLGMRVTEIGPMAFSGQAGLTEFTVPEGVRSLGSCAFAGCANLRSIKLPASLAAIGDAAFAGCPVDMKISVPEGSWARAWVEGMGYELFD